MDKTQDEIRKFLRPFTVFELYTRSLLHELNNLCDHYDSAKFELQIDLSQNFYLMSFCSFFSSAYNNIKTMLTGGGQYSFKEFLRKAEEVKKGLADNTDPRYDENYINDTLESIHEELKSWEERFNAIMIPTTDNELQSFMWFYNRYSLDHHFFKKYQPCILELIEIDNYVNKVTDGLCINIFGGIKDKDYTKKYESDINKTFSAVKQHCSDWNEVNSYFKKFNKLRGINELEVVKLNHQSKEIIDRIIDDLKRFPDNQAKVTESGALFREYLKMQYDGLSRESIFNLVDAFCFINR